MRPASFGIERDERLVQHQQIRFDGKGAGERDAAGKTEREFAWIVKTMLGQLERGEQLAELCLAYTRRHEPHVFFDRAPRQQPRLLKDDAQLAV